MGNMIDRQEENRDGSEVRQARLGEYQVGGGSGEEVQNRGDPMNWKTAVVSYW